MSSSPDSPTSGASSSPIQDRALDLLDRNDEDGFRSAHLEHFDFDAFDEGRYADVVVALDGRITQVRYSIISMMLAAIYFGLIVGTYLVGSTSGWGMLRWLGPVLLVSIYAVVTGQSMLDRIERLTTARGLVAALAAKRDPDPSAAEGGPPPAER
jgi:hypothetical protein